MDKQYGHKIKEPEIYEIWESNKVFSPEGARSNRNNKFINEAYSVLMPPPNANAPLHCGHATYAIQDLMVRFKRMKGYDVLYLPGTDHAGFETQVVYERNLKKQGKSRFDFDRESFYQQVLSFVKENSNIAINQLKRIGLSADWNRNTFMLDQNVINRVYETFLRMHKDGLVYRDGYMVNYSTYHGTTFSDLETEYKESVSPLYYVRYKFVDDLSKSIVVATVRPETIYADVAVAVNPKDQRYKSYVGKKVYNPLTNREIPIISDDYVEIDFGTGALKITPAHDFNDYQIGKKHNLQVISLINLDGRMNANSLDCEGLFPQQARKKSAEILSKNDAIEKIDEKYTNRVLVDYKDQFPIEPMVLPNWFLDTNKLMEPVISAVKNEEVKFNLEMWKKEILRWLEEKKPWPISRQTVFGIRIPAWYVINKDVNPGIQVTFIDSKGEYKSGNVYDLLNSFSLEEIKSGLQKIIVPENSKYIVQTDSPGENYIQETDTFDTWFSSGQWPLTTTGYPDSLEHKKYFPTDFLDSAYDIIFFWIARMIMFSIYLTGKVPFKMVYFHGLITDKHGKKMSKSKGNVINPMEFVDKYGADALRMGILVGGNTEAKLSPLDEDKVRGYRNFANKIWNIGRYIKMKEEEFSGIPELNLKDIKLNPEDSNILRELNILNKTATSAIEKLKFKTAGEEIYHFIWESLANGYLEAIKDRKDVEAYSVLKFVYKNSLKLLHPFMPFITEAVWQEMNENTKDERMIIVASWPEEFEI